jgi:hypothetical protein
LAIDSEGAQLAAAMSKRLESTGCRTLTLLSLVVSIHNEEESIPHLRSAYQSWRTTIEAGTELPVFRFRKRSQKIVDDLHELLAAVGLKAA